MQTPSSLRSDISLQDADTGIEAGNTQDDPPLSAIHWMSEYLQIVAIMEITYSDYHLPQVRRSYIQ